MRVVLTNIIRECRQINGDHESQLNAGGDPRSCTQQNGLGQPPGTAPSGPAKAAAVQLDSKQLTCMKSTL